MARMRRRNGQAGVWTAEARRNVEVGSWTVEARRPSKRRGDHLQLRLSHLTSILIARVDAIASGAMHRMPSSIFAMLYLDFRLCVSLLTQWGPTLLLLQYRILVAPASAEAAS